MLISAAYFALDRSSPLTLAASLIGVASLAFCAGGDRTGQALMIVFSLLYGILSFSFAYYGEMLTYVGMTMPMAVASPVSWLRHPFGDGTRVEIGRLGKAERVLLWPLSAAVTVAFCFILKAFGTADLLPSTVSVLTSFVAVCLSVRRSPYFALAYATNDIVLILLWTLAAAENTRYISVTVCFAAFLVNNMYAFFSWPARSRRQRLTCGREK